MNVKSVTNLIKEDEMKTAIRFILAISFMMLSGCAVYPIGGYAGPRMFMQYPTYDSPYGTYHYHSYTSCDDGHCRRSGYRYHLYDPRWP